MSSFSIARNLGFGARAAEKAFDFSAARSIMERKTWFLYEMIYLLVSPPRPDAERKDGDLP